MSCAGSCPQGSEEEKQNKIKWSERIENLLSSEQGREQFIAFLDRFDLEEDLELITFWKMLSRLQELSLAILETQKSITRDTSLTVLMLRYNSESEDLLNFALDKVNLDLMQLQELTAIKDGPEQCLRLAPGIKASVDSLLKPNYDEFVKSLVESRNSLNC